MKHQEGRFRGRDDLELYYQSWLPSRPRARVAIAHGFGEHGGRYGAIVEQLVARGIAVYALDHRGHGRSPGQRGHVDSWGDYREDLGGFLRVVGGEKPGRPNFLYGHSMGAIISLDYVLRDPVPLDGVIISAASVRPVGVASPLLVFAARTMSQWWPTFSLKLGLPAEGISRDPAAIDGYRTDPLVHDDASARWGTEVLATIEWIFAHVGELRHPILMLHGDADPIASADGTRELFRLVKHRAKKLRLYQGGYHEPHNDVIRERVANDVANWIEKRLAARER